MNSMMEPSMGKTSAQNSIRECSIAMINTGNWQGMIPIQPSARTPDHNKKARPTKFKGVEWVPLEVKKFKAKIKSCQKSTESYL